MIDGYTSLVDTEISRTLAPRVAEELYERLVTREISFPNFVMNCRLEKARFRCAMIFEAWMILTVGVLPSDRSVHIAPPAKSLTLRPKLAMALHNTRPDHAKK